MQALIAVICGGLFGAGLAISGMADPARIRGFLDVFGAWDPTLAFVMLGALIPMALAWLMRARLQTPAVAATFDLPAAGTIDRPLLLGATIFGAGWGIAGLCPGPAIAGLALRPQQAWLFVAAMAAGMFLHRLWTQRLAPSK